MFKATRSTMPTDPPSEFGRKGGCYSDRNMLVELRIGRKKKEKPEKVKKTRKTSKTTAEKESDSLALCGWVAETTKMTLS